MFSLFSLLPLALHWNMCYIRQLCVHLCASRNSNEKLGPTHICFLCEPLPTAPTTGGPSHRILSPYAYDVPSHLPSLTILPERKADPQVSELSTATCPQPHYFGGCSPPPRLNFGDRGAEPEAGAASSSSSSASPPRLGRGR